MIRVLSKNAGQVLVLGALVGLAMGPSHASPALHGSPQLSLESAVQYQSEKASGVEGIRVDVKVKDPSAPKPYFAIEVLLPGGLIKKLELARRAPGSPSWVNPYAPPKAEEPTGRTRGDLVADVVPAACRAWLSHADGDDWRRENMRDLNVFFEDFGRYWSASLSGCEYFISMPRADIAERGLWLELPGRRPYAEDDYLKYASVGGLKVDVQRDRDNRPVLSVRTRVTGNVAQGIVDREALKIGRELIDRAITDGHAVAAVAVYIEGRAGFYWDLDLLKWKVDVKNAPDAKLKALAQPLGAETEPRALAGGVRPAPRASDESRSAGRGRSDTNDAAPMTEDELQRRRQAIDSCEEGIRYAEGDGVAKDPHRAARWFKRAADQGSLPCQFLLALCHLLGNGVEQDEARAIALLRDAAARGHGGAGKLLKELESDGR